MTHLLKAANLICQKHLKLNIHQTLSISQPLTYFHKFRNKYDMENISAKENSYISEKKLNMVGVIKI